MSKLEDRVKQLEAQVVKLTGIKKKTHFHTHIVLDESSSMESCWDETIMGVNSYIKELDSTSEFSYTVTLQKFSSNAGSFVYEAEPVGKIPALDKTTFRPRGNTALLDAIGLGIESAEKLENDETDIILVIVTDGGENASRRFTTEQIREIVTAKQDNHNWSIIYLGANQDAWSVGNSLGTNYAYNFNTNNMGAVFAATASNVVMDSASRNFSGTRLSSDAYGKTYKDADIDSK